MIVACLHPIRVDLLVNAKGVEVLPDAPLLRGWRRECALCGHGYDRSILLAALASRCWAAWSIDFGRVSQAVRDEGEWRHEEFVP